MSDTKTREQILTEHGIVNRGTHKGIDTIHLQIGESKYKSVLDAMEEYKQQANDPTTSDEPALNIDLVIETLPTMDEAGVIALGILEDNNAELTDQEQAFFVAGFSSCIQYLDKEK